MIRPSLFAIALALSLPSRAQLVGDMDDESKLYAQSKQVNQFFHRFNGEEDEKGKRYYEGDKQYRSPKLRKKYLGIIFDEANAGISPALKTDFAKAILDPSKTAVLDFHGPGWFAEVHTIFANPAGKEQAVVLFMELEKDHLGTKWVIHKAYSDIFKPYFVRDTTRIGRFLHPMSHELDFMNLRRAFVNDSITQFTDRRFTPDHLSVLLYEIKKGDLKFKSVTEVNFHFFQIDGWYFEISDFNRPGYNTGWLISNLVKINTPADKEALQKYVTYENH